MCEIANSLLHVGEELLHLLLNHLLDVLSKLLDLAGHLGGCMVGLLSGSHEEILELLDIKLWKRNGDWLLGFLADLVATLGDD
jgi:hypothetical protein